MLDLDQRKASCTFHMDSLDHDRRKLTLNAEQAALPELHIKVSLMHCRDDALLVVICSRLVEGLCSPGIEGCVYVDGPQNATVNCATELPSWLRTSYKLQVAWPVS